MNLSGLPGPYRLTSSFIVYSVYSPLLVEEKSLNLFLNSSRITLYRSPCIIKHYTQPSTTDIDTRARLTYFIARQQTSATSSIARSTFNHNLSISSSKTCHETKIFHSWSAFLTLFGELASIRGGFRWHCECRSLRLRHFNRRKIREHSMNSGY